MKRIIMMVLTAALLVSGVCFALEQWVCPNCGTQNEHAFCGNCGTAKPGWICSSCGKENTTDYCVYCGASRPASSLAVSRNITIGDTVSFGTYPQTKERTNKTPIEWKVLDVQDNKALLISKYGIDTNPYDTTWKDTTWEKCTLRTWLNEKFFNTAFSTAEQAIIENADVSAEKNPKCNTKPGKATTDKIFLLSIAEAEKYFTTDNDRKCAPTEYAIKKDAYTSDRYTVGDKVTCNWWLRSPGSCQAYAAYIGYNGSIDFNGTYNYLGVVCIRPALWVNLK